MSEQTPDIGEIISKLTANPQALSGIMSMLGGSLGGAAGGTPPDISDKLPDISEKLPDMISVLAPLLGGMQPKKPDCNVPPPPPMHCNGALLPRRPDCKSLLLALKPYMSKSRCDAIDYIIKITGILALLGNLPKQ